MFSSRTQCFNYSQLRIYAYLLTLVKYCFILSKSIEFRLKSIVNQTCRDMICTMSNHLIFFWLWNRYEFLGFKQRMEWKKKHKVKNNNDIATCLNILNWTMDVHIERRINCTANTYFFFYMYKDYYKETKLYIEVLRSS